MGDVERRLTATLERVAASTRVRDRWDEVAEPRRGPARAGWVGLAVGFAVVVAAIALVPALVRTVEPPVATGDAPPLAEDEQPAVTPGPVAGGSLPRLVLDLPDATLIHAEENRLPGDVGVPPPVPGHHQYFAAGESLAPPLVHVVSWTGPDGAVDELAEVVEVRGREGLLTRHGQFVALEWRDPDVSYVQVRAAGIGADEVVALVEAMELRDDPAEGFDLPAVPAGVAPVYEGRSPDPDPDFVSSWSSGVSYQLGDGQEASIRLWLTARPLQALADAVFGAAWDAESFDVAEVRSVPAVAAETGPQHSVVVWREGAVIGMLHADVPRDRLPEVLEGLREVGEAEWRELVVDTAATGAFADPFELPPDSAAEQVAQAALREVCSIAARWLEFTVAGQPEAAELEAASIADLVASSDEALATAPSRYGTVVRRLGEAVRAGSLAAVEAEYAGTEFGPPQCS